MPAVTINDVRDGINAVLDANFPGIDIAGEEIEQGLREPCFFVKLLEGAQEQELGRRYRRYHSFDVHYFGTDNRTMHTTAEKLYDVLETIAIPGGSCRGTGMRHEIVDRVLHFFVDYNFQVWRPAPVDPDMMVLDQQGGLKA